MKKFIYLSALIVIVLLFPSGCNNPFSSNREKRKEDTTYNPAINPENFVTQIDNKYYPLKPGTKYFYQVETEEGTERNEVYVTHETKTILGVPCVVVDDRVWLNDELIEATLDWYAQDKEGNVWYFGEASKEYEKGKVVSAEGSWEAGLDGAKPGIIMKANPVVGHIYRQEYYFNHAEDMAEVLSLSESASVPYGPFENCVKTKDWNPLEKDTIEEKYYAPGVGVVLEVMVQGGSERVELITITTE